MSRIQGKADVVGAVIAGGKATRLGGQAKALIPIHGRTVLDRVLAVLEPRVQAVVISANDPAPYAHTQVPVIPDLEPDQGPLAGIAAALRWSRRPYILAVACDMPFLHPGVIELLLARRAPGVDVIAPVVNHTPQPLCTLYSQRVLPVVEERLRAGALKAMDLVTDPALNARLVYEPELRAADPELVCFTNLNTPEDVAGAS